MICLRSVFYTKAVDKGIRGCSLILLPVQLAPPVSVVERSLVIRPFISCCLASSTQLVIIFTYLLPVSHRLQSWLKGRSTWWSCCCCGQDAGGLVGTLKIWAGVGSRAHGSATEWCKMSTTAGSAWLQDSPVRQILTPYYQKAFFVRIVFFRVEFISWFGF